MIKDARFKRTQLMAHIINTNCLESITFFSLSAVSGIVHKFHEAMLKTAWVKANFGYTLQTKGHNSRYCLADIAGLQTWPNFCAESIMYKFHKAMLKTTLSYSKDVAGFDHVL